MRLDDDVGKYLARIVSPSIHPGSFALFRALYCGALLFFMWDDYELIPFFSQGRLYHPVPTFSLLGLPVFSEPVLYLIYGGLVAGLVLGGIGIGSRIPFLVVTLSYFYLQGLEMGFTKPPFTQYVYHSRNLGVFVLLILTLAPAYAHQNVLKALREPLSKRCSGWPAQLIKVTLAIAYFGAAYIRLTTSTKWLNGYTLQAYLLERYLLNSNDLALELAHSIPLDIVLSWFAVLLESFFFLAVLIPRTGLLLVPAGVGFHFGNWLIMDIQFFPYFVTAYLSFVVDVREYWLRWKHPGLRIATAAMERAHKLIFGGVAAVLLTCVFARVEYWPFTDFGVFSHPSHWSVVKVTRIGIQPPDGAFRWSEEEDFCFLKRHVVYSRYRSARMNDASWYMRRLHDEAKRAAHPERIPNGSVLTVFERKVRVDGSEIETVDDPLARFAVSDDRSLCH